MPRFALTVEYDGRPFAGWQRQKNALSVQQVIEDACVKLVDHEVLVYGSGRTDAGVHGIGMVAHVDIERDFEADKLMAAINFHLGDHPVAIIKAEKVDDDFHARFDAVQRRYMYRILNRRAKSTFQEGLVWQVPVALDADEMALAAKHLIGRHDFTTFRSVHCQSKSPVKTLDSLEVVRDGEMITITTSARSFLYHQVRSMVGSLKLVGQGKWCASDIKAALEAKDRHALGFNAPADGLYFVGVDYLPQDKRGG